MFEIYNFNETEILAFVLVMIRLSVFIAIWPVFNATNIPPQAKILFSLVITLLIFPLIGYKKLSADLQSQLFLFMVMREVFIGLTLGFLSRMVFYVINIAGEIISFGVGLSNAQVFFPSMDFRGSALEQFFIILTSLFFLAINGHHHFLTAIIESFRLVPLSAVGVNISQFGGMAEIVQAVVFLGLKLSAPILIAMLLMNIAMGIVGRAVPQVNVFITSIPVNLMVGFLLMIVCLPLFLNGMQVSLDDSLTYIVKMMKAF